MNVVLDPEMEAFVRREVAGGRFAGPGEVVREALLLLDELQRTRRLHAALEVGQAELDRGEGRPYSPELREEIRRAARSNAADEGWSPNDDLVA